jgi:hypothetical protein
MESLLNEIAEKLINHNSVVLVGPTDLGKTRWVKTALIPYLRSLGKDPQYLEDGDAPLGKVSDIAICDEVETLFDELFLQGGSSEKYYDQKYLKRVRSWYAKYAILPEGALYIVTRNTHDQIENLVKNFHNTDWDKRQVYVAEFKARTAAEMP